MFVVEEVRKNKVKNYHLVNMDLGPFLAQLLFVAKAGYSKNWCKTGSHYH